MPRPRSERSAPIAQPLLAVARGPPVSSEPAGRAPARGGGPRAAGAAASPPRHAGADGVRGEGVALPGAEAAEVGGRDVGHAVAVAADGDVVGVGGGCVAIPERAGGPEEQEEWEHTDESETRSTEAGHRRAAIGATHELLHGRAGEHRLPSARSVAPTVARRRVRRKSVGTYSSSASRRPPARISPSVSAA